MLSYDINTHGDFQRCYDTTQRRNYWLLGYFGGGAINVVDAYELAKQFAEAIKVPLDTVKIDEVLSSRRYKYFKFIYSDAREQDMEAGSYKLPNVYQWLTD